MTTILRDSYQIAKKVHKCNYCGLFISVGEEYNYSVLTYYDFYIWKSHISCRLLTEKLNLFKEAGDEGVTHEFFWESVYQKYVDLTGNESSQKSWEEQLNVVKEHYKIAF